MNELNQLHPINDGKPDQMGQYWYGASIQCPAECEGGRIEGVMCIRCTDRAQWCPPGRVPLRGSEVPVWWWRKRVNWLETEVDRLGQENERLTDELLQSRRLLTNEAKAHGQTEAERDRLREAAEPVIKHNVAFIHTSEGRIMKGWVGVATEDHQRLRAALAGKEDE